MIVLRCTNCNSIKVTVFSLNPEFECEDCGNIFSYKEADWTEEAGEIYGQ